MNRRAASSSSSSTPAGRSWRLSITAASSLRPVLPPSAISRSRCPVSVGRAIPRGAVAVRAQPLDPDPSLDHAQHIAPGIVSLQDHAAEVDERAHRGLGVAAGAALELLALALRGTVSAAERAVVDLDRVIGRPLERLDAQRHQHGEASFGRDPGKRLVGLVAPGLREPRPPVRRQPLEIEPVSAELAGQECALLARDPAPWRSRSSAVFAAMQAEDDADGGEPGRGSATRPSRCGDRDRCRSPPQSSHAGRRSARSGSR